MQLSMYEFQYQILKVEQSENIPEIKHPQPENVRNDFQN